MGRRPLAPSLTHNGKKWVLRFTHDGVRHQFAVATIRAGDAKAARAWMADRVAFVYSGAWKREADQGTDPAADLKQVAALYLAQKAGGEITERTAALYKLHLKKQFLPRWKKLSDVTAGALATWQAERLKSVRYQTVKKELSTLRQVLRFAEDQGWISSLPKFPRAPKKATGTAHKNAPSGYTHGFTVEHAAALIAELPQLSRPDRAEGIRWPLRAFFAFQDATGQRPGLIEGLRYGVHWRRGDRTLRITADIDKNRWERTIPLSDAAVAALESVEPQADGRMFRHLDFRASLRAAAKRAGLPEHIAEKVHAYDLRHARTTEWVERSGQIAGVGFLVGHKQATTTNRYTHSDARLGLEVLESSGGVATDSGSNTGSNSEGGTKDEASAVSGEG